MGRKRPEIAEGVRSFSVPHHHIAYYRTEVVPGGAQVLVVRVLHGAMDPERLTDAIEPER